MNLRRNLLRQTFGVNRTRRNSIYRDPMTTAQLHRHRIRQRILRSLSSPINRSRAHSQPRRNRADIDYPAAARHIREGCLDSENGAVNDGLEDRVKRFPVSLESFLRVSSRGIVYWQQ